MSRNTENTQNGPHKGHWPKLDISKLEMLSSTGRITYLNYLEIKFMWHYCTVHLNNPILFLFAGGMYGLAAHEERDENSNRWMEIAKGITNTCHESYDRTDTKLGPEAFRFTEAVEARAMKANERYYILRPETIESYFIMWRLTHDQKYRDWGWEAVQVRSWNFFWYLWS